MAAGLLDDYHITSLDDPTPLGRFMSREFGFVRDEILESYPWHIAKDRVLLTAVQTPPFGWQYQYVLPTDCLRALPPNAGGNWNGDPIPYEVESGKLLCNYAPPLPLIFIRRETNVAKWTALMARAFAAKMAMYAAQRVTGKIQYFDKCRQAYGDAMGEARLVDSLTRGTAEHYYSNGFDGLDAVSARGVGALR